MLSNNRLIPQTLHEGFTLYSVEIEINNKDHRRISAIKFLQEYKDYAHMEHEFRLWAKDINKTLSEGNYVDISAYYPNTISDTWMHMTEYRTLEDRFLTF